MTALRPATLLCALLLAGSVPLAHAENDKQPPGQERKAPAAEPTAEPTPQPTPEPAKEPAAKDNPGQNKKREAQATPTPAPTAQPAPQPTAAPAAEQPLPPATRQPTTRRRGDRRSRARTRPRTRVPVIERAVAPEPATATDAPAPAPLQAIADPASATRPDRTPAPADAGPRDQPRSPIARTVTEFVEVVPEPLRTLVGALAVVALLAACGFGASALRARRAERRRDHLAEDVVLLQRALLPPLPEHVGRARVTAAYKPSDGPGAGGDFYDAFALDEDRTCVILGDVAGHGRDALPFTALVRYTLRAYLESGLAPRRAIQLAGEVLDPQLRGRMVTAIAAIYDARTGELTYASAGHPIPARAGREPCAAPPLGAGVPTGRRSTTIPLRPAEMVCLFTDGLVDVRVEDGRLGARRLAETLDALGPEAEAADVLARIEECALRCDDDMTALVLRAPDDGIEPPSTRLDELEVDLYDLANRRPTRFLTACGVAPDGVAAAMDAAATLVARHGRAPLVVSRTDGEAEVSVRGLALAGLG